MQCLYCVPVLLSQCNIIRLLSKYYVCVIWSYRTVINACHTKYTLAQPCQRVFAFCTGCSVTITSLRKLPHLLLLSESSCPHCSTLPVSASTCSAITNKNSVADLVLLRCDLCMIFPVSDILAPVACFMVEMFWLEHLPWGEMMKPCLSINPLFVSGHLLLSATKALDRNR